MANTTVLINFSFYLYLWNLKVRDIRIISVYNTVCYTLHNTKLKCYTLHNS